MSIALYVTIISCCLTDLLYCIWDLIACANTVTFLGSAIITMRDFWPGIHFCMTIVIYWCDISYHNDERSVAWDSFMCNYCDLLMWHCSNRPTDLPLVMVNLIEDQLNQFYILMHHIFWIYVLFTACSSWCKFLSHPWANVCTRNDLVLCAAGFRRVSIHELQSASCALVLSIMCSRQPGVKVIIYCIMHSCINNSRRQLVPSRIDQCVNARQR